MTRKEFLKLSALLIASPLFSNILESKETKKMPSLFIGNGSPMNIIRDNTFTKSLKNIVNTFEKPKAIVVISAHWFEGETLISNSLTQKTIYDFRGFPKELYEVSYNPKGHPALASQLSEVLDDSILEDRGLDHGAWSVLKHMYPNQDIPTFQISINYNLTYEQHFEIAKILSKLRNHGVLVIGSGSITHNLRLTNSRAFKIDKWALDFDNFVKDSFSNKKLSNLVDAQFHPLFEINHPFDDHYIPLLYTAGTVEKEDIIEHFHEEIVSGNLSMRCIKVG